MAATREAGFGDEVKRRIMIGTYALSSGYYDAYYGQAQKVRTLISQDFDRAFAAVDVLVSPSTPITAFKLGEKVDDPLAMYMNDLCTIPSNLAGNAGASFPIGLAPEDGLPVGLQVMAPPLADDQLYRVGAALERELQSPLGRFAARPDSGAGGGPMSVRARVRRRPRAVRPGARPRGARRAQHRLEDVLRLLDGVRRRPQHADLPGLSGSAWLAAGGERQGDRVGHPDRAGAELLDRRVVPLRPEELLLSGHAEELPDLPVRRADRVRRLDRGRGRTARRTGSASSGPTWRRTPASRCTSAARPGGSTVPTIHCSTTTAPACR